MTLQDIIKDELKRYDSRQIDSQTARDRIEYLLTGYFFDDDLEDQIKFLKTLKKRGIVAKVFPKDPISDLINELENIPT